nr:hypothetical protein [Aquitalea magnusonii]
MLDWLKLLGSEDISSEELASRHDKASLPPLAGALLKNEQDLSLFERLAQMTKLRRG